MTEQGPQPSPSNSHLKQQTHARRLAANSARVLLSVSRPLRGKGAGKAGCRLAPAIRRGKYAMRAMASMSFDQAIAYTESQIAITAMTEDAKEGLKAFGEKRKPVWTGR